MPSLTFNRELRFGDVLTILTIFVSLITILRSWSLDRELRITKDANEIRAASAKALGELERWEEITQSVHANAQTVFVEASEMVAAVEPSAARGKTVIQARDLMWRKLNDLFSAAHKRIVDERIDSGYLGLFSYFPQTRQIYVDTLARLDAAGVEMRNDLLVRIERSILSFKNLQEPIESAEIGNALRAVSNEVKTKYGERFKKERAVSDQFFLEKIKARDDELLASAKAAKL